MSIRDLGIIEITVFLVLLAAFLFFFGLFVMLRHRQRYSGVRYARKQRLMEKALLLCKAAFRCCILPFPQATSCRCSPFLRKAASCCRALSFLKAVSCLDSRDEGRAGQGWKRTGQEQNRSSQRTQYGASLQGRFPLLYSVFPAGCLPLLPASL